MKTNNNDINDYINKNYDNLKKILKKEYRKLETNEFDEDIFHETLIKCIDIFKTKESFEENDFIPYLVASFKTNVIRNTHYHSNSMRSNVDIENIDNEIIYKDNIDFNIILEDIKTTFGVENYDKFMDWLENKTIQEINEAYNCKNSRYIIDKIKNYLKNQYNNNFLDSSKYIY